MARRNPALATGSDTVHAILWGLAVAALVVAGIYAGSRGLRDFDPALVSYAGASVFAAFGLAYRYAMWLRRPPTRLYWRRGWQIFWARGRRRAHLRLLGRLLWDTIVLQRFIERRSRLRWAAHWTIAWGCLLAAAVTFPLSFGWVRFETPRDSQAVYDAYVAGLRVFRFRLDGPLAPVVFNILVVSAALVIVGVVLALWRRGRDRGALAVQQFSNDLLPLALLFAVSVTGLFLSASTHWLGGLQYGFLSQLHAVAVIFTLLYLPFGKFFHVFQRPAQLGVAFYKRAAEAGERLRCRRCGEPFAARLHIDDLMLVEGALGIRYALPDGGHYQHVCPACRRRVVAIAQDLLWRTARSAGVGASASGAPGAGHPHG